MTVGRPSSDESQREPSTPAHPLVHDGKVVLDLTKRPTREAFGLSDGEPVAKTGGSGPFEVTVILPTGTLKLTAFGVAAATDSAGGLKDTNPTHVPKFFTIHVTYPDAKTTFDTLDKQADLLGLDRETLGIDRPDFGAGALVPQQGVVQGFIKGWLDTYVDITDFTDDGGGIQVIYEFNVDWFHNEAVDKILHAGKIHLDLIKKPTREELAFLPTYNTADVFAEPGQLLDVTVDTIRGPLRIATDAVSSTSGNADVLDDDAHGVKPPGYLSLGGGATTQQIHQELLNNAPTLGIDRRSINQYFDPASPRVRDKIIATVHTKVFDLAVKLTTTDGFGSLGADVTYQFTF